MPNLRAVESVVWAHLGSHVAQAPRSIMDVQSISISSAWTMLKSGWITVTHRGVSELGLPSFISRAGVTIFISHALSYVYTNTYIYRKFCFIYIYLYQTIAYGRADELSHAVDDARGNWFEADHHGAKGHSWIQVGSAHVTEGLNSIYIDIYGWLEMYDN